MERHAIKKMKQCFKCGATKPLAEFYRHPKMADGHLGKCMECAKRDVSANYRARRDYYEAYERRRFQRPERRAAAADSMRRLRLRNPDKDAAWKAVSNAIRGGKLTRQPCEVCGSQRSQAHHDDYSRPLDVRWLCRRHHLEVHGKVAFGDARKA